MLTDAIDRTVRYLRISLTEACQMRCVYCRPMDHVNRHEEPVLTPQRIKQLVSHLVQHHGLRKVRLTGGDPTARRDLLKIIETIASIDGLEDFGMTTNGLTMACDARDFVNAGLDRVNISLDALDQATFRRITGVDGLHRVLAGIDEAIDSGLTPVKINTVAMRYANDAQLPALVDYAAQRNLAIRFIELMPMGPLASEWARHYIRAQEIQALLSPMVASWTPLARSSESAQMYAARLHDGRNARIGLITPMSCNFCEACDRLRIASDGNVYPCLMGQSEGNIEPAFREGFDGPMLDHLLEHALRRKAPVHGAQGLITMTCLGG